MAHVKPRLIALDVETVDRSSEVSSAVIPSAADGDGFMSYSRARSGGARAYSLDMVIAQDHASATLWNLIYTGAGTEVDYVYAPYGNEVATVAEPHYTGTAIVSEPNGPMFGAPATESTTAVATVEVSWRLTGKPVLVTGV